MEVITHSIIEGALAIITMGICIVFIRAIKGPRFTDRLIAINMIGTMVTAIICILAIYFDSVALIDVSLVYTLLSFLSVVVICHIVTLKHRSRELNLQKEGEAKKE